MEGVHDLAGDSEVKRRDEAAHRRARSLPSDLGTKKKKMSINFLGYPHLLGLVMRGFRLDIGIYSPLK